MYLITNKNVFYDKGQFTQICTSIAHAEEHIDLPPPAIIKVIRHPFLLPEAVFRKSILQLDGREQFDVTRFFMDMPSVGINPPLDLRG